MKLAKSLTPILALAALAACDGGSTVGSGSSRLTIRLHDAPGDLEEAWVKVEEVYLQGSSAADSTAGRQTLLDVPTGWIELTDLTGSNFATLVSGVVVPAGRYTQLRFVVCDAYVVTRDGDVYATDDADLPAGVDADGELRVPSGCQSGFKVKLPGGAVELENDSEVLSVDFDVSQSFGHQAGNSGAWVMHPVMTATDVEFTGGITGTVAPAAGVTLPACGGAATSVQTFAPLAVVGADSLSGVVGANGTYSIAVSPGTYAMSYAPLYTFTNGDSLTVAATAAPATATVASGGSTTVNYTITSATCH